jgi:hypothetical protein
MSKSSGAGPAAGDLNRLTDDEKVILGRARQIAGMPGTAAVRACYGTTAVSDADTARAYAKALDDGTWVTGELIAIIERLADGGAAVTTESGRGEPSARSQPESGCQAEAVGASPAIAAGDRRLIRPRTYEITFTGRAGNVLRAAFDDCTATVGLGTTTLRAQLPDQAALWGLVQRIIGLRLEVVDLHVVAPES